MLSQAPNDIDKKNIKKHSPPTLTLGARGCERYHERVHGHLSLSIVSGGRIVHCDWFAANAVHPANSAQAACSMRFAHHTPHRQLIPEAAHRQHARQASHIEVNYGTLQKYRRSDGSHNVALGSEKACSETGNRFASPRRRQEASGSRCGLQCNRHSSPRLVVALAARLSRR